MKHTMSDILDNKLCVSNLFQSLMCFKFVSIALTPQEQTSVVKICPIMAIYILGYNLKFSALKWHVNECQ